MTRAKAAAPLAPPSPAVSAKLARLIHGAKGYADKSRSERTKHNYKVCWKYFKAWCAEVGACPLPATPETVAAYLVAMVGGWTSPAERRRAAGFARSAVARGGVARPARTERRPGTLDVHLAAIGKAHLVAKLDNPRKHEIVRATRKGIRNVHGAASYKKAAVLPDGALKMLDRMDLETLKGLRDRALLLVGVHLGFRRAELTGLVLRDLTFAERGIVVHLGRSKTDQEGKGRDVGIPLEGGPLCPVAALHGWLDAAKITEDDLPPEKKFVFQAIHRNGTRWRPGSPLSGRNVARIVKGWAASAGLPGDYAGHSLRAGFVTSAAMVGKSLLAIMEHTDHKRVETVLGYVRKTNLLDDDNAARGIMQPPPKKGTDAQD